MTAYREGSIDALSPDLAACLPPSGPLHRYMAWAIKTTDAEALFHLGSILPCWSHAVASRGFRIDEQHRIVPKVWTFLVGVPASSKSTAMKRATTLYRSFVQATGTIDPFVLAEGSVPGIFEALAERYDPTLDATPGIVYRDEAARLLDTKDSVADMLCNIIDGEDVKRHLRGARAANADKANSVKDTLVRPSFAGILTTTFSRLREVTKASYLEGGLYSRFLWFVGQPRLPNQSLEWDPHRAEEAQVLTAWEDWARWANGQQALGTPLVVKVSREVTELLRSTLFADLERHGATDNRLNAARKRGLTQAVQIAGLYALSQCRLFATPEDMDAAINLVELCLGGLERLDPSLAVDEFMQVTDAAFHVVASAGPSGLPTSRLYASLRRSKNVVDAIVETLLAEGSIRRVKTATGKPGRPATMLAACGTTRYSGDPESDDEAPAATNVIRFPKPAGTA